MPSKHCYQPATLNIVTETLIPQCRDNFILQPEAELSERYSIRGRPITTEGIEEDEIAYRREERYTKMH